MNYTYRSNFKQYIEGLIEQKQALGFSYITSIKSLRSFDSMCVGEFPAEAALTKEIGDKWSIIRPTEKRNSFRNRVAVIRELAKYMIRSGVDACVIDPLVVPAYAQNSMPHIFTDNELKMFFTAADKLEYNRLCKIRHVIVPTIFRLMYCCGLRPPEARLIRTENIDFVEKTIKIPESKGHKDRMVVMSDGVSALCEKYFMLMKNVFPHSEYMFPCQQTNGGPISRQRLLDAFCMCWNASGIGEYSGNKPLPYSFRHTFATKKLYAWMKEGKDLEAYLPYLSAYMGHSRFAHTAYYIHLVPEFFPQMAQMDLSRWSNLLPEANA
jgi:integrase